jgi:hypothetical protein
MVVVMVVLVVARIAHRQQPHQPGTTDGARCQRQAMIGWRQHETIGNECAQQYTAERNDRADALPP